MGELRRYLLSMGIEDEALIEEMFKALDMDQDGRLSFSEFAAGALLLFKDMLEERLHMLFQCHDSGHDGALDVKEARNFLNDVLATLDTDSQGSSAKALDEVMGSRKGKKVTYEELREYVLGSGTMVSSRASSAKSF